jgi:hypothetical protein
MVCLELEFFEMYLNRLKRSQEKISLSNTLSLGWHVAYLPSEGGQVEQHILRCMRYCGP